VFKIAWKLSSRQREAPNDLSPPLKRRRREVKVDPKLGGQWKVPSLVAIRRFQAWWPLESSMFGGQWKVPSLVVNGRFQAWWPMEGFKLGGQWKVPSLVANGRFQAWWPMEGSKFGGHWNVPSLVAIGRWRKNAFSPLPYSLNQLNLHLHFFPSTLRFYCTMVLSRYSRLSFLFFDL